MADVLRGEGWNVELTAGVGDYGVDAFAQRGEERIAVQAKMYGTSRRINRATVMQLFGAAAYFDCTGALLATDGELLPDAEVVAAKLNIAVRTIPTYGHQRSQPEIGDGISFEFIWERFIVPLQGRTLARQDGRSNDIVRVDWTGVERRTSNGRTGSIGIEIFRMVVNRLLNGETVTREEINDEYPQRASSGIVLILSQVPFFEVTTNPTAIRYIDVGV